MQTLASQLSSTLIQTLASQLSSTLMQTFASQLSSILMQTLASQLSSILMQTLASQLSSTLTQLLFSCDLDTRKLSCKLSLLISHSLARALAAKDRNKVKPICNSYIATKYSKKVDQDDFFKDINYISSSNEPNIYSMPFLSHYRSILG
jgi:hypothetical protein